MDVQVPSLDPLADLRPAYVERLRGRVTSLRDFLHDVDQGNLCDSTISESHRCVHSMISSAAIFGHMELSRAARAAEQTFEQRSKHGTEPLVHRIQTLLTTANEVLSVYEKPNTQL
jgi:HPt (histidine-containing phosphotransfer) domain-containing protein